MNDAAGGEHILYGAVGKVLQGEKTMMQDGYYMVRWGSVATCIARRMVLQGGQ